jgi:hypothetical protein
MQLTGHQSYQRRELFFTDVAEMALKSEISAGSLAFFDCRGTSKVSGTAPQKISGITR